MCHFKKLLMRKPLQRFSLLSLCCFALSMSSIYGQCFKDRHNLTLGNSWISCEESLSPNLARGNSNWIMYDLGTQYALGETHFWNINNYIHQDDGMRNIAIDVSVNGSTWTEAAVFELEKGAVSGFYEGVAGPDLTGTDARYLLITGLSNYGGACMGLSEFRVQATPATTSVSEAELGAQLIPSPSPFSDITRIDITLPTDGQYQYTVSSMDGKIVNTGQVQVAGSTGFVTIQGSELVAGAYIFTLTNGSASSSLRIIKQ
jgi:hypothetical protein